MTEALVLETIRSTDTRIFNGDGCGIEWIWDRVNERYGIESTPRSYFERGTLGHAMIEAHLNGDVDPMEILKSYIPPEGDWLETTKCTKEGILDEVYTLYDKWTTQYRTLEEYQDIYTIDTEVTLKCVTPNGTPISTEADAIFTYNGGSVALADWKLGTSKSGKAMQLYTYWYCMRRTEYVDDRHPFRAWFHYPSYAKPIVHIKDYPGDTFIEAYIDNAQIQRTEGPYLPNPDWFRCSQCEWKDKCPLWGGDWEETRKIEVIVV